MRASLVTDGSSDRVLAPILKWLLEEAGFPNPEVTWANLAAVQSAPRQSELAARAGLARTLYPCDVLFFHRDAEGMDLPSRQQEIRAAIPDAVCVVPVRMTEAWLLFDEKAIRQAASNPHGKGPLALPKLRDIELLKDPKQALRDALQQASGLTGRRLASFNVREACQLIPRYVQNFAPLRSLDGFSAVEAQINRIPRT